jgi:hypothetical protein
MIGLFFILTFVAHLAVYARQEGRVCDSPTLFTGTSYHRGGQQTRPLAGFSTSLAKEFPA